MILTVPRCTSGFTLSLVIPSPLAAAYSRYTMERPMNAHIRVN